MMAKYPDQLLHAWHHRYVCEVAMEHFLMGIGISSEHEIIPI